MPSIWTILEWIIYGLVRYVLSLVPLVRAPTVDRWIPSQWWTYNNYSDWAHKTYDGGHPDEHWARSWLEMSFGELQRVATEKAKPYVDALRTVLVSLVGYIRPGFGSTGAWVNWLQGLTGSYVPHFASNLAAASNWLWNKLPSEIRGSALSWDQLWDNIKASVRQWAQARYDSARAWAYDSLNWVHGVGEQLRQWRSSVAGWIDQVRYDPYGFVVGQLGDAWHWLRGFRDNARAMVRGWLGPEWDSLVTFARDCTSFYYNLWALGWRTLDDFIEDPKGFIIDLVENAILDRW